MKLNKWIIVFIILIPILIGIFVSIPCFSWLVTSNDWIGFWGGYAGAIIGGLITLFVLSETIKCNREAEENRNKRELCMKVANLVSNFCIEMMAYRSKWNTLYEKSEGKEIDALAKIEVGATTEEPRRLYFELEILLRNNKNAEELLTALKNTLEGKLTQKSVKETDIIMTELREKARRFIDNYTQDIDYSKARRNNEKSVQ